MKRQFMLLVLLFVFLFSLPAHAHPGATDENGGHYDYDAGEYHYHHGYPAHHHGIGYCPYNFDDRTGEDSGTPGLGAGVKLYTTAPRPTAVPQGNTSQSKQGMTFFQWVVMVGGVLFLLFIITELHATLLAKERKARLDRKNAVPPPPSDTLKEADAEAQKLLKLSGIRITQTTPPPVQPPVAPLPPVSSPSVLPAKPPVATPRPAVEKKPSAFPGPTPRVYISSRVPVTPDPEPTPDDLPNCPVLYRTQYPASWSYIRHNAKNPESYVYYYHYVWGKLQEHHGDGIIYGTLSDEEQALVNYPNVGRLVYMSSVNSDKYHSTPNCYALLKSTPIEVDAIQAIVRERCTKCVPPRKTQ